MTYLLDVNVLLALFDPGHLHREKALAWFNVAAPLSWATCPITENGFVRIASHHNYPNSPGNPVVVAALLGQLKDVGKHHFWPDSLSLHDRRSFNLTSKLTSHQLTDVYLLGLAASHNGRLATFDRSIPVDQVRGGSAAIELIS